MSIKRNPKLERGVTLIELIVFIVVISVGLAGVLTTFNVVVKGSADPLVIKQAFAVADSLLEEILLKDFCDPSSAIEISGDTTTGSPVVSAVSPNTAGILSGWRAFGPGIPAGATVLSSTATTLTLSGNVSTGTAGVKTRYLPCTVDREAARSGYDDVRDYHNTTWQDARDINGNTIFTPSSSYQTQVEVSFPVLSGTAGTGLPAGCDTVSGNGCDVYQVTVSILARDGQTYRVTGYRYNYD